MKTDILSFDYTDQEWENIPQIIPKYLASINKVFLKMKMWQEEKDKLESAQHVKESITDMIRGTNESLKNLTTWSREYQDNQSDRLDELREVDKEMDEKITLFYNKLEKEEMFDVSDMLGDHYHKTDGDSDEEFEVKKPEGSTTQFDLMKTEPRFWSFDHIHTIIMRLLNSSKIKKKQSELNVRFKENKHILDKVQNEIDTLIAKVGQMHKNLEKNIFDNNAATVERLDHHDKKLDHVYDLLENLNFKTANHLKRIDENDNNNKATKVLIEKVQTKIAALEGSTKDRMEQLKNELLEFISKAQHKFDKQSKYLMVEFGRQKTENLQKIDESREYTYQELTKSQMKLDESMDSFYNSYQRTFESFSNKTSNTIKSIKQDLDQFRTKSSETHEIFDQEFLSIRAQFETIQNTVYSPNHELISKVNEFNTNMSHLESKFNKNAYTLREILKKLIYTMESSLISGKAIETIEKEQSKMSTTLIDIKNVSRMRFETPDRAKDSYEHVFLKRLQFLKSLLKEDNKLNSIDETTPVSNNRLFDMSTYSKNEQSVLSGFDISKSEMRDSSIRGFDTNTNFNRKDRMRKTFDQRDFSNIKRIEKDTSEMSVVLPRVSKHLYSNQIEEK